MKKKVSSEKSLLKIFLLFFFIINIMIWIYIIFLHQHKKEHSPSLSHSYHPNEKIDLPHFTLGNFQGKRFNSKELNSKLNILIFFSLSDCPGCLYEAEYWSETHKTINEESIRIWGITETSNKEAIEEFCK